MSKICEGAITIDVDLPTGDVTSKMDVFYNPKMASNRNISVTFLKALGRKNLEVALPLAGSGVRAFRFLKELDPSVIKRVFVNDKKEDFERTVKSNLKANGLDDSRLIVRNEEASLFMLSEGDKHPTDDFIGYFDYIDLDPFGSISPFLASAIARIPRNGILAVTCTDTAAFTGTYPKVTRRKYWARNVKNNLMHEMGLRILIRRVQLQGAQFDKALTPIVSYHKDHYFRVYFMCLKGKLKCDAILDQHKYVLYNPKTLEFEVSTFNKKEGFDFIGPVWCGRLFYGALIKEMIRVNTFASEQKFLESLYKESKLDVVGFYDIHAIAKRYKIKIPKIDVVLEKLEGVRSHLNVNAVKSKKSLKEVLEILKE